MAKDEQNIKLNNFIIKSKLVHGNRYDYSLVNYVNAKTKIKIICPIHGEFEQRPDSHLNGSGCYKCSLVDKTKTNDKILDEFNKIHGNKYDYSLVNYVNIKTKVKIICLDHGEFEQTPDSHLNGSGCPICGNINITKKLTKTNDKILDEFNKINGNKYDYSLVNYINAKTKVKIICPIHGIFEQTPNTHLSGCGCQKCGDKRISEKKLYSLDEFIFCVTKLHHNKYDYSLVNYINGKVKVNIICPEHGEFKQTPYSHLSGRGCQKCGINTRNNNITKTINTFMLDVKLVHGDKYDYSNVEYINSKNKIKIMCPVHGEFEQTPDGHLSGSGCPKCVNIISKPEEELFEFLNVNAIISNISDRKILNGKELDIFIPKYNVAIEFDGLYWHSELFKDKNYHLNKTNLCKEQGVQLIHIFEDEWIYKQDIVKSRLKNILGLTENKIFARKCIIKEVNSKDKTLFLDNNHLQGSVKSSINIGLYHNNQLVSLMCFNKPRAGIGALYDGYELSRFANILNTNVIGGASKLLNYFELTYKPKNIISYTDLRWSTGNLYETLGFVETHRNKPNYWYKLGNKRSHRFGFRKSILEKQGFDISNKTEHQIMLDRKIYRIYDCGTITYSKKY